MDSIIQQWTTRAEYDLKSAGVMLAGRRYLYVAFMCQQSLEKMLKALIASEDQAPPFIHNLVRLAQDAKCYNAMNEKHQMLLADLNPYYIKSRYGEYKDELSKVCTGRKAKYFYEQTIEVIKWLKHELK